MMYRNWVEISLERIGSNYDALRRACGVELCAVVKADAYRHGAERVAQALQLRGCRWFAVSNAEEGAKLRAGGITGRILVMGDFLPFERELLRHHRLTPVIHSLERFKDYRRFAALQLASNWPVHLKLDTGMGRLGTRAAIAEVIETLRDGAPLQVEGLTTHFAAASDFDSPQTAQQIACFQAGLAALRAAGIDPPVVHLSSSAPVVFGVKEAFGTMVRPGISLYGYGLTGSGSAPACQADVRPALGWKARILEIRDLPAGTAVGYNARWHAQRDSRIGVIACGYADGVPQQLSCTGHAVVARRVVPMVGAVSMDLITLDLTDVPEARIGDVASLIGPGYDAEDMAREAGVISYAILCGLGNRVARVYTD
jgi:alanine racemase